MFERFTVQARQVIVLAQEEARTLKHNYIGTEHILLGLVREQEGLAARVLDTFGITLERVRMQVVRIVGSGEELNPGRSPFTPRAKKILSLGLREALTLRHDDIGTEHILLGLLRESEGVAARILLDFDADREKIRNEVIRMLSRPGVGQRGTATESQRLASQTAESPFEEAAVAPPSDIALGWRARPMALAALGAAVLARMTFDSSRTRHLEALEMQVLVRLMLGPPDPAPAEPGELVESMMVALACERDELNAAVRVLTDQRLVSFDERDNGDQRVSITTAGTHAVRTWLEQAAPLFGRWPPDHPSSDDATG